MQIEAITVSVGYADFLAVTAQHNAGVLDDWLIVTTEDDLATREVCRRHSLRMLLSRDHVRDGHKFNKGRLIERGLQHLSSGGWRLHLDADIVLPSRFRQHLRAAQIEPHKIYGADRIMVRSYKQWLRLRESGWLTHDYHCRVNPPPGFPVGTRWAHHNVGYVPIGFFQLWHAQEDLWRGARIRGYPQRHNDACRTDVQHALQWDRNCRELIPEMLVVHLESEAVKNGANWCGRKTQHFGPCPTDPAPSPYC
jgi:hypothetical protein